MASLHIVFSDNEDTILEDLRTKWGMSKYETVKRIVRMHPELIKRINEIKESEKEISKMIKREKEVKNE